MVPGDSFTGSLSRVPGEALGSYAILQGTLALDQNYVLSYVGANLTIVPLTDTLTTVLSSSAPSSAFGQLVTFTAIVVPASGEGQPTGSVVFVDGSTVLGSSPLSGSLAVFSTSSLGVASHRIVARFLGDGFFSPSQSPVLNQTVNPSFTTTSFLAVPSSNHRGFSLDVSVAAAYPGAGIPTGRVVIAVKGRGSRTVKLVNGQAQLHVTNQQALRNWFNATFVSNTNSYKHSVSKAVFLTRQNFLPKVRS